MNYQNHPKVAVSAFRFQDIAALYFGEDFKCNGCFYRKGHADGKEIAAVEIEEYGGSIKLNERKEANLVLFVFEEKRLMVV